MPKRLFVRPPYRPPQPPRPQPQPPRPQPQPPRPQPQPPRPQPQPPRPQPQPPRPQPQPPRPPLPPPRPVQPLPPAKLPVRLMDYGPQPFVVDIEQATLQNNNYRTTLWTGQNLQLTLMTILPGDDIGLERHDHVDQFLRVEEGQGLVQMGPARNNLNFRQVAFKDTAVIVPAGTWHNITNIGDTPLKLYSIYAPPNHAHGTVHRTKAIAEMEEGH